jgi:hypothetical protein
METTTTTTKSKKEKKTTNADFLKEFEEKIDNLDETVLNELLLKYGKSFHPLEMKRTGIFTKVVSLLKARNEKITNPNVEQTKQMIKDAYNTIFPLKDSYTPAEFIKEITRDFRFESKYVYNDVDRLTYYIDHLSQEAIDSMSEEERNLFMIKVETEEIFNTIPRALRQKLQEVMKPKTRKNYRTMSLIPSEPQKLNMLPEEIPIYFYGGHGKDICIQNEVVEAIVPENCILITTGVCGRTTPYRKSRIDFFKRKDEETRRFLRYPYLQQNMEKLSKMLDVPISDIHIKYPGDSYIASYFFPAATWDFNDFFLLNVSGLCEKRDMEQIPEFNSEQYSIANQYYIWKSLFPSLFIKDFKSQYPLDVTSIVEKLEEVINKIDFETLVSRRHPVVIADIGKSMKESIYMKLRSPSTIVYWKNIAKKKSMIESEEEFTKNMIELFHSLSVREFLGFFQASSFPTPAYVYKVCEDAYKNIHGHKAKFDLDTQLDFPFIDKIGKNIFLKNRNEKITVEKHTLFDSYSTPNIIKNFPGIHYFTICRSVDPGCEPAANLRRTKSTEQETKRREIALEKLSVLTAAPNKNQLGGTRKHKKIIRRKTRKAGHK